MRRDVVYIIGGANILTSTTSSSEGSKVIQYIVHQALMQFSRKLRERFFRAEPFRVSTSSEVHRVKLILCT